MRGYVRFQSLRLERCGKFLLAVAVLVGGFQRITFAASPVGLWYAEGGAAEVEIHPCSDGLCGRVVWLRSPIGDDGCELRDGKNPDPVARGKTILGLVVLHGLKQLDAEGRQWAGGTIYDPVSGRTYSCNARLDGDDRLFLWGFLGIQLLGRTTTWTRVGAEKRQCESSRPHTKPCRVAGVEQTMRPK
jgi:uncharacterized protein (DUF2147 family)